MAKCPVRFPTKESIANDWLSTSVDATFNQQQPAMIQCDTAQTHNSCCPRHSTPNHLVLLKYGHLTGSRKNLASQAQFNSSICAYCHFLSLSSFLVNVKHYVGQKSSFNMNNIINNSFSSLLSGKSADWDCDDPQFADKMLTYNTSDRVVAIHAAPSKNGQILVNFSEPHPKLKRPANGEDSGSIFVCKNVGSGKRATWTA